MKETDRKRHSGWFERRFADFDHRLKGILGEERIPRREKRARADQAAEAVNDLIDRIAADVGNIDKRPTG